MTDDFVHLHTHSDFSQLDGCGSVGRYVAVAAERGNPAIGFSEHGTMRGIHELAKVAGKYGVKPIYGIEFYVCEDMHRRGLTAEEKEAARADRGDATKAEAVKAAEEREGVKKRWHLTVWARDDVGLRNLYRLSSSAWLDGYYYRPRIDLAALEAHGEGLTVATGCLGSPVNSLVTRGQVRAAITVADRLFDSFGENLWLEVMPHDMDEQRLANAFAVGARKRYGGRARLLATQDAHYVHAEDWEHHEVLLCIGTRAVMSDKGRFRFPGPHDYHFKDRAEMEASFASAHAFMSGAQVKEALDSTVEIGEAATASVTLDRFRCLLPPVDMPAKYGGDEFGFLHDLCRLGWEWREISDRAARRAAKLGVPKAQAVSEYARRLARELATLRDRGIAPYFLMVRDFYEFARREGIARGPGRGSSAGSLVAYLLGITAVDPVEHGLMFERFISPGRVDMPDIDCDFEDVRRDEIFGYLREKYGVDRVSQIATMGQLGARQCLDDVARVYELPYLERKRLTAEVSGGESLGEALDRSPVLKKLAASKPHIIEHALALEGLNKVPGMHAAGMVTSPVPLADVVPLETRGQGGERVVVTALDMHGCADWGLLKLDILGLRTVTMFRMVTERLAGQGTALDMERVPLDDDATLQAFTDHDYVGVFQFDSSSAQKVTRGATFREFDDIAIYNALNRPGTTRSGLAEEYARRRASPGSVEHASYHEWTGHITGDTLGIILYQEQVIRVLTDVGGFSAGDADELRRKIGKSLGAAVIRAEADKFVEGALRKHPTIPREVAEELFTDIEQFGAYGFNRCLTGGTVLSRADGTTITVAEAFEVQHARTPLGDKFRCGRWRVLQMDADGQVRPGVVKAIHDNGVRVVSRIRTAGGRVVDATDNHRFLTDAGYRRVSQLGAGSMLVCMGEQGEVARRERAYRGRGVEYQGQAGGKGFPVGADNPSWIDGRPVMLDQARSAVAVRAGARCEECGMVEPGRFEFAHTQPLESLGGDFQRYHSADNIRLLCNSCHKRFDYQKGERHAAWSCGKPTMLDVIASIERPVGEERVYDVEMATDQHNFIANGIVSHNSHAVAYGMISYWCQYLKVHHPLEFFWALMCTEPSIDSVKRYVADARAHGIKVVPADVNLSGLAFRISDADGAVVGSLGDIKGVGPTAARVVEDTQPFAGLLDFLARTRSRQVNRKVVAALAEAGALRKLAPNTRWLVDSLKDLWRTRQKRDLTEADVTPPAGAPDYDAEERLLVSSRVCPVAADADPFDLYLASVSEHVGVDIVHNPFADGSPPAYCWVGGIVVASSLYTVGTGDVFGGRKMTAVEKARHEWGKKAGYFVLASSLGTDRIRIDDAASQHPEIVEAGKGQPLLALVQVDKERETMRALALVNLATVRANARAGRPRTAWEALAAGREPAELVSWASKAERRRRMSAGRVGVSSIRVTGVVATVREKVTRRGKPMAIFHVVGPGRTPRIVFCFEEWPDYRGALLPGAVASLVLGPAKIPGWVLGRGPVTVHLPGTAPARRGA